jgi:hypothetical protein
MMKLLQELQQNQLFGEMSKRFQISGKASLPLSVYKCVKRIPAKTQ